jgi:pyrroline-5-carboxylate reductase
MKLGFIGVGKIANALIEGLCTSGIENTMYNLSPRNKENSTNLASKYHNIKRFDNNQDVLDQSDIVFIALIPAKAKDVLNELVFDARHTVISLVPLLKYADLAKSVYPATNICRAIPLPPVINHNCPIPVFNANDEVIEIFNHVGQPMVVADEKQLCAIWTLTGLITPFYDLLNELSHWTTAKGVDNQIANQYIANLFQSLSFMAQKANPIDFEKLAQHAATSGGMNEQAGKEIKEKGAHQVYVTASDNLLKRFE